MWSGRERENRVIFRSRPQFSNPSRRCFLFPPSTIPPQGVLFPSRLFPVPLSAPFPTVSRPTVCPVVPIPSRRSHTISPVPHLIVEAVISIPFTTGFHVSPSYDHGCNYHMLLWIQQQQLQQHIFYKVIFSSVFSFFPCQKEQFFLPEVGRLRPPHEIGSQQGREDFVSQVQQVKVPKIPGIGKVVRVLQAL